MSINHTKNSEKSVQKDKKTAKKQQKTTKNGSKKTLHGGGRGGPLGRSWGSIGTVVEVLLPGGEGVFYQAARGLLPGGKGVSHRSSGGIKAREGAPQRRGTPPFSGVTALFGQKNTKFTVERPQIDKNHHFSGTRTEGTGDRTICQRFHYHEGLRHW